MPKKSSQRIGRPRSPAIACAVQAVRNGSHPIEAAEAFACNRASLYSAMAREGVHPPSRVGLRDFKARRIRELDQPIRTVSEIARLVGCTRGYVSMVLAGSREAMAGR